MTDGVTFNYRPCVLCNITTTSVKGKTQILIEIHSIIMIMHQAKALFPCRDNGLVKNASYSSYELNKEMQDVQTHIVSIHKQIEVPLY